MECEPDGCLPEWTKGWDYDFLLHYAYHERKDCVRALRQAKRDGKEYWHLLHAYRYWKRLYLQLRQQHS
jgi:hypothetical protein